MSIILNIYIEKMYTTVYQQQRELSQIKEQRKPFRRVEKGNETQKINHIRKNIIICKKDGGRG